MVGYHIESAAQEITQLFWLADTAAVCGWASDAESARFKHFCVRFISAHLSQRSKTALVNMVSEPRFDATLQQAALDGASENCGSSRWRAGWSTFKAAADENEDRY